MAGLSDLTWRGYRRVSGKQRRAIRGVMGSSFVVAELVEAVMGMGWELGRRRRAQEVAAAKKVVAAETAAAAAAATNKAAAATNKAAAATTNKATTAAAETRWQQQG